MKEMNVLIEELGLGKNIRPEDMPGIDLYMDQVIQLFENNFGETKRNEEEKILTKTMINNYAKGKLFLPVKKKKYTREHLILISLIYQLKGALSISDIKRAIHAINEKAEKKELNLERLYSSYLSLSDQNAEDFKSDLTERAEKAKDEAKRIDEKKPEDLERLLLIASLVNISNMYRRVAERLIDDIGVTPKKK